MDISTAVPEANSSSPKWAQNITVIDVIRKRAKQAPPAMTEVFEKATHITADCTQILQPAILNFAANQTNQTIPVTLECPDNQAIVIPSIKFKYDVSVRRADNLPWALGAAGPAFEMEEGVVWNKAAMTYNGVSGVRLPFFPMAAQFQSITYGNDKDKGAGAGQVFTKAFQTELYTRTCSALEDRILYMLLDQKPNSRFVENSMDPMDNVYGASELAPTLPDLPPSGSVFVRDTDVVQGVEEKLVVRGLTMSDFGSVRHDYDLSPCNNMLLAPYGMNITLWFQLLADRDRLKLATRIRTRAHGAGADAVAAGPWIDVYMNIANLRIEFDTLCTYPPSQMPSATSNLTPVKNMDGAEDANDAEIVSDKNTWANQVPVYCIVDEDINVKKITMNNEVGNQFLPQALVMFVRNGNAFSFTSISGPNKTLLNFARDNVIRSLQIRMPGENGQDSEVLNLFSPNGDRQFNNDAGANSADIETMKRLYTCTYFAPVSMRQPTTLPLLERIWKNERLWKNNVGARQNDLPILSSSLLVFRPYLSQNVYPGLLCAVRKGTIQFSITFTDAFNADKAAHPEDHVNDVVNVVGLLMQQVSLRVAVQDYNNQPKYYIDQAKTTPTFTV